MGEAHTPLYIRQNLPRNEKERDLGKNLIFELFEKNTFKDNIYADPRGKRFFFNKFAYLDNLLILFYFLPI